MTTFATPQQPSKMPDYEPPRDDEAYGEAESREEAEAVEMVLSRKQESQAYRTDTSSGTMSLEDEWRDNGDRFIGNDTGAIHTSGLQEGFRVLLANNAANSKYETRRVKLLRTQNSIISNVAATNSQAIRGRLLPAETGDTDGWFMDKHVGKIIYDLIEQQVQSLNESFNAASQQAYAGNPNVESPDKLAARLESETQAIYGKYGNLTIDQMIGEYGPSEMITQRQYATLLANPEIAGILDADSFIPMNDTFVTREVQRVLDVKWDQAGADLHILMNSLQTRMFGQGAIGFRWHDDGPYRHSFTIENKHILNIWVDPTHYDPMSWEYYIEEQLVSVDRAKNQWPGFDDLFDRAASEGMQHSDDQFTRSGMYDNVDYKRKMLSIVTGWFRYQSVPMTKAQALEDGLVELVVPEPPVDDLGQPIIDADFSAEPYYVLAGTDTVVEPQEKINHGTKWPNTEGLRQIMVIPSIKRRISDIRCPYWDIPVVWNINIPRPDMGAYGQGEPVRLRDLDYQIDSTLSTIAGYMQFYRFPQYFWPASVMAKVRAKGFELHCRPGANIPIPDVDYYKIMQSGGFDRIRHNIPVVPPHFMGYLELLLREHDTASWNSGIRQGKAPFSGASGELVKELGSQASSSLALASKFAEFAVTRLCKLAIEAIVAWLPEKQWAKILNKYEIPVIREIIRRASINEWNAVVSVATGKGEVKKYEQEQAIQLYDRQLKSKLKTMELFGEEDPEAEQNRIVQELAAMAGGGQQTQ